MADFLTRGDHRCQGFVPRLCLCATNRPVLRAKMNSEVESMQNGSIMRSERRRGPDVWEYRWREPGADGKRKHRRMVVGPVNQFRDKESVIRATSCPASGHQHGKCSR